MAEIKKESRWGLLEIILYVINYFKTELAFLFSPGRAFSQKPTFLTHPEIFLLSNIILTYLIFKVPVPVEISDLQTILVPFKELAAYSGVILKYVIGITIFLFILAQHLKRHGINVLSRRGYSVICYASAVFLPIALIKYFLDFIMGTTFMNLITPIFSRSHFEFHSLDLIKILIFISGNIALIFWWGWIVNTGIKYSFNLNPKLLSKITRSSILKFICLQCFLIFLIFCIGFVTMIIGAIKMGETQQIMTLKNPNYLKAALLMEEVSNTNLMGPSIQYRAKIRAITYKLGTILVDRRKTQFLLPILIGDINKEDYVSVQNKLTEFLTTASENEDDQLRANYIDLLDELRKTKEYRSSKYFNTGKTITVGYFVSVQDSPLPILYP